jgi:hypothetical protein
LVLSLQTAPMTKRRSGLCRIGVHRKEVGLAVGVDVNDGVAVDAPRHQVADGLLELQGVDSIHGFCHVVTVDQEVDGTHVRFLLTSLGHDETSGDTLVSKVVEEGQHRCHGSTNGS